MTRDPPSLWYINSPPPDCLRNRFKKKQHAQITEKGQKTSDKLHYITQLDAFGNACGSIAAMHAVANSLDAVPIAADGLLAKFIKSTSEAPKPSNYPPIDHDLEPAINLIGGLSADDRGKALLTCSAIKGLSDKCAGSDAASTSCPDADDKVMAHFIAFVHKGKCTNCQRCRVECMLQRCLCFDV